MDKKECSTIVEGMLVGLRGANNCLPTPGLKKGIVVEVEDLHPAYVFHFPTRTQSVRVLWPRALWPSMYFNDELVPVENQNENC